MSTYSDLKQWLVYGTVVEPSVKYEVVKISWQDLAKLLNVVEAAKAFRTSMTGEWPADHYDLLCKALEELESDR